MEISFSFSGCEDASSVLFCGDMARIAITFVLLLAIFVCLCAPAGTAQESAQCLVRTVVVRVEGPSVSATRRIPMAEFRAELGGKPLVIKSIAPIVESRRAVLLLDASGSMADDEKWKWLTAIRMAEHIVATAPPDLSLALVTISTKFNDEVGFRNAERNIIGQQLRSYATDEQLPLGKTPLYDAVEKAMSLLQPVRFGDAIYVFSDGGDNASKQGLEVLERRLATAGIQLNAIVLAGIVPHTEQERWGPVGLQQFAEATGGSAIRLNGKDERGATRALAKLSDMLRDPGVRMIFELPGRTDNWRRWRLDLLDANGKKKPAGTRIFYPQLLPPCSKP